MLCSMFSASTRAIATLQTCYMCQTTKIFFPEVSSAAIKNQWTQMDMEGASECLRWTIQGTLYVVALHIVSVYQYIGLILPPRL